MTVDFHEKHGTTIDRVDSWDCFLLIQLRTQSAFHQLRIHSRLPVGRVAVSPVFSFEAAISWFSWSRFNPHALLSYHTCFAHPLLEPHRQISSFPCHQDYRIARC